jgi:hypothetical protein
MQQSLLLQIIAQGSRSNLDLIILTQQRVIDFITWSVTVVSSNLQQQYLFLPQNGLTLDPKVRTD